MIHHVHVPRTVLACALLALVTSANPVCAADDGGSFTSLSVSDTSLQAAAAAAAPAVITPAAPTVTTNGLLTFTNQAEFQTAFPGLPKEDFEESPVGAGGIVGFPEPLNSTTNVPGAFAPGDILTGLTIQTVEGIHPADGLYVIGNGFYANASKAVGINYFLDTMDISFTGSDVYAAGMDLMLSAAASVTISIYGSGGTLLDTLTPTILTTATFFGIYSSQPITRITVASAGQGEIVDNIQFGGTPSSLTFFTSQAAFTTAHPGLPVEDFEESPIADTAGLAITGPIDSTSNIPGIFSPGDILAGLRINGVTGTAMAILGGNYLSFGNTTTIVAENSSVDGLRFDFFNYNAYAVGMDLMRAFVAGNVTMAVYGPHGILLGTTSRMVQLSETFVGVYANQPITRIEILDAADFDFVDNIRFGGAPAGLTFYNSQASFLAARPGLPVEDFEESPVADGGVKTCTQPFNSATNEAGCFAPGDIIPGITFQPQAPCVTDCTMAILGAGYNLAPSKEIAPSWCVNDLEITFAKKNVRYFGSNIRSFFGPADYLLSFYDDHGNLIGSALRNIGTTPIYLGAISQKHISKILVTDVAGCEIVDNVRFGAFPWQTIIPAISGH